MSNLSSYCGLVDAKMRASNIDLPVPTFHFTKVIFRDKAGVKKKLFKFLPELRELEPRAPGPSGTSDTEFDLEVLTAEGVEAPDIGGSPEIKENLPF